MPQIAQAERDGWPEDYTGEGMASTRAFFGLTGGDGEGVRAPRSR